MENLEKITNWGRNDLSVSALILTGSLAGKGKKDDLSDYDIAVFGSEFGFIEDDNWIKKIGDYLVCIHDEFKLFNTEIPTRLVILHNGTKIDFSFHPVSLLHRLANLERLPDSYNLGYRVLLDKEGITSTMAAPNYRGFLIQKPSEKDFEINMKEFWFEIYHVAKYLFREDLWAAKSWAAAASKWLLQMMEWHHAVKAKWKFSPKDEGRNMKSWTDKKTWKDLHDCFGRFDRKDSWKAMERMGKLYRRIAIKTAGHLNFTYDQKLDHGITHFIKHLK